MGFGWLMVGYFFANVMPLYSVLSFAMLAGYPMMIFGLRRLAPYHARFHVCFYVALFSLPFAVYFTLYGLTTAFGIFTSLSILKGTFYTVMEWLYFLYSFVLHAALLFAISGLSAELRLLRHQSAALRNFVLVAVYCAFYLIARLPIPWLTENQGLFALPLLLLRFLYIFLDIWLLFRCYRFICPQGDESMPEREKRKLSKKEIDLEEEEPHDEA